MPYEPESCEGGSNGSSELMKVEKNSIHLMKNVDATAPC